MSFVRVLSRRALGLFGYELRRKSYYALPRHQGLTAYQAAVLALASERTRLRIVIVGANDGRYNDPLYHLIRNFLPKQTSLTLIEPQSNLHPHIEKNFAFHNDVRILAAPVGAGGTLFLHRIKQCHWKRAQPSYAKHWPVHRAPTGVTSSDRSLVLDWARAHIVGIEEPESAVETVEVQAEPLDVLLRRADRPPAIDVLQIDAEGADDKVLSYSRLDILRPSLINFESKLLSQQVHHNTIDYLFKLGYYCFPASEDTLAIRKITKACEF